MIQWIKRFFKKLIAREQCAKKLALSFCMGNYIAFSPFIGFHGLMAFLSSWLLRLNLGVTFTVAYTVNNIWTAIPVYMADYVFGHWLLHSVLKLNLSPYTPAWMESWSLYLGQKLGVASICFWSFLIGGNILGIITSIGMYPAIQRFFNYMLQQKNENSSTK